MCLVATVSDLPGGTQEACAQYTNIFHSYMTQGKEALEEGRYQDALLFFETAQIVSPGDAELNQYLNLVKRHIEDRIQGAPIQPAKSRSVPADVPAATSYKEAARVSASADPRPALGSRPKPAITRVSPEPDVTTPILDLPPQDQTPVAATPNVALPYQKNFKTIALDLDATLWASQPNTLLEIPLNTKVLVRSTATIERYLVIIPDQIAVERVSHSEIILTPLKRGQTFFHLWDSNDQRWTFNIANVLPLSEQNIFDVSEPQRQTSFDNFKITYDTSWNSFYTGPSKSDVDRDSMLFRNTFGIYGPTPYGRVDGSITYSRTDIEPTKAKDYTAGITEGYIGPLKDFSLRIFDAQRELSPLTLPGQVFRGALYEDSFGDGTFDLTLLRGQARLTYGPIAPGLSLSDDTYVEGGRIQYNLPESKDLVAVNYAHSWGDDRSSEAKDKAYSAEYEKQLGEYTRFFSEVAHDEDETAYRLRTKYQEGRDRFELRFRDIPAEYGTAMGTPINQGEIGTEMSWGTDWHAFQLSSYLDVYRDHSLENPEDPDALNTDFSLSAYRPLPGKAAWRTDAYFYHTPGLISDEIDYRLSSTLSKNFSIFGKNLYNYLTGSVHQKRSDSNPQTDYDRNSVTLGMNYPLTKKLRLFMNYDLYWITDRGGDNSESHPEALTTNLIYSHSFNEEWRLESSISYRDEERTEGSKTFLAGEDSLSTGLNLSYFPTPDLSIYLDGRVRDVWTEKNTQDAYTECDVRFGVRSTWDTGLSWNPQGIVNGYVFKDVNMNGQRDADEPGIGGVTVRIGETSALTDRTGWYYADVRAASVLITPDVQTIPTGYIFKETSGARYTIGHGSAITHDIALTSNSGIFGVAFVDANGNGTPEADEQKLRSVRVLVNREFEYVTDSRGAYFVTDLKAGQHDLAIDLGSIPMEFLPTIPLTATITIDEGTTYIFNIPVQPKK